jgi:hypothetical protein
MSFDREIGHPVPSAGGASDTGSVSGVEHAPGVLRYLPR